MPRAKITWCDLQYLVDEETKSIKDKIKWPIIMMVGLGISIPIIIYLSSKASYSMRSSSKRFDEQALSLNLERRKTDGLLSQLLPADIISMLKTGFQILYNSCYGSYIEKGVHSRRIFHLQGFKFQDSSRNPDYTRALVYFSVILLVLPTWPPWVLQVG